MSIFPERWQGRLIPTHNIPKNYVKDGKVYETKTNKEIKMEANKIKQSQREQEQLVYQREMFWGQSEPQQMIKELLQKIYDLEDKVELLSKS